jgi:hypothetical protein
MTAMKPAVPPDLDPLDRLQMFIMLVPIMGVVPALWYRYQGLAPGPVRDVSRLALQLGLAWVVLTVLCQTGASAQFSQVATLRFWLASSFVGSGYFLVNLWLMVRIWQRKSIKLPGLSRNGLFR